jgi:menaquinone-dependent protoporphyrinogen oxidase
MMLRRILIAYATKYGSTEEVAAAVAAELRAMGVEVDVVEARAVRDVTEYDAVVVGAPLYMGRWHRDARALLRRLSDALAVRPLAVFALGPLKADGSDVAGAQRQLDAALAKAAVRPADVILFGGALEPGKLRFPLNRMPRADVRDWVTIRAWARGLREVLEHAATLRRDVTAVT